MDAQKCIDTAKTWSDEKFKAVVLGLLDQNRPAPILKEIRNKAQNVSARAGRATPVTKDGPGVSGVSKERDTEEWPGPQLRRPGMEREDSHSAWKSPAIIRGDLIPTWEFVYVDVEKLTLMDTHEQVASSVAIVNDNGNVVVWSFLKWNNVCLTHPSLTGITKQKLETGLPINTIKPFIDATFDGNTVVGWAVENDFLALTIPKTDFPAFLDISCYFVDRQGQKMRLKDVWKSLCGKDKDGKEKPEFQCGIHCAIQDARATRAVHRKMLELRTKYPNDMTYPWGKEPDIVRSPKTPYVHDRDDVCRCKKSKTKKLKQKSFFLPVDDED